MTKLYENEQNKLLKACMKTTHTIDKLPKHLSLGC